MKSKTTVLPPDPGGLITALRSIGYTLKAAVADLVDNSLDAKATKVLVRFIHDDSQILKIIIADNGNGMSDAKLHKSMGFGHKDDLAAEGRLGKYGLGMKLSSLSQTTSFSVISRRSASGIPAGRRWTIEGIKKGWLIEELGRMEIDQYIKRQIGPIEVNQHGTIVIWEDLDRLPVKKGDVHKAIGRYKKDVSRHLGLVFHRLLDAPKKKLSLYIDSQQSADGNSEASLVHVRSLNPFGYPPEKGGKTHVMEAELGEGNLTLHCHTWPPNSETPNYKLPKGAARAQGLYVYRNKRLIQYGGWGGLRDADADPHLSLARVMIDLPARLDSNFGLDLKKASIEPPPSFVPAVETAKSSDGTTFRKYIANADKVYRHKDSKAKHSRPAVPRAGIASGLRPKIRKLLGANSKAKEIDIAWESFDSPEVFRIDIEDQRLLLNKAYRQRLLAGRKASRSDAPDLKLLLFMLVRDDFKSHRLSKQRRQQLEQLNDLLTLLCRTS